MNYKRGDFVKIKNGKPSHGFKEGEHVRIVEVFKNDYLVEDIDGESGFVLNSEIEDKITSFEL